MNNIWNWENKHNEDKIIMSVLIPNFIDEIILQHVLDSLKLQVNVDFKWELVILILEKQYQIKRIIKPFINLLPNCSRILINSGFPNTLNMDNLKHITQGLDANSEILVIQDSNYISPPRRLEFHFKNFTNFNDLNCSNNTNCLISCQNKTVLYNALNKKIIVHKGRNKADPKYFNLFFQNIAIAINKFKKSFTDKKLGNPLFFQFIKDYMHNLPNNGEKLIHTDRDLGKNDNWKYGIYLDLRGLYNFSPRFYDLKIKDPLNPQWYSMQMIKNKYKSPSLYLPKNVMNTINTISVTPPKIRQTKPNKIRQANVPKIAQLKLAKMSATIQPKDRVSNIITKKAIKVIRQNKDPKFSRSRIDEKIWKWQNRDEINKIVMTVALPALNAEKIIWLALESLKNQKNVNFKWELICMEEWGIARKIFASYAGKLPNCARMVHYNINPVAESKYRGGEFKDKYLLIDKWRNIAKMASKNSKIYVMHAIDCYSPPKRLSIHFNHFKNPACFFSTQRKGIFYNIFTEDKMVYNGANFDGPYKIIKSTYRNNFYSYNHLNMALRVDDMKRIKPLKRNRKIDRYILTCIAQLNNIDFIKKKHIFIDEEVDPNNWKYSLDTDGYNNISSSRRGIYSDLKLPFKKKNIIVWELLNDKFRRENNYISIESYIPAYVLKKLKQIKQ